MSAPGQPGARSADAPECGACGDMIDALRAQGAVHFDAVGLRFVEALARRTAAQPDDVRRALERRLAQALTDFRERFARARRDAGDALTRGSARFPHATDALRQHHEAGDFRALHRLLAQLDAQARPDPLAELLALVAPPDASSGRDPATAARPAPRRELKSLQHFRRTWSKLSVDRQLSHALARAPDNAGPLNSHHLVLQALQHMRALSPAYLEQFMSYADALLWLEQADGGRSGAATKAAAKGVARGERDGKRDGKRKPARGKAG